MEIAESNRKVLTRKRDGFRVQSDSLLLLRSCNSSNTGIGYFIEINIV